MHDMGKARGLFGRMRFAENEDPPAFVVTASGAIGPRLVRNDLARAETFGHAHPEGWCYIGNVRRVLYVSPRNIRYLRKIRKLPNNKGYFLVGLFPLRRAVPFLRVLGGPQKGYRNLDKALAAADRRLSRGSRFGSRRKARRAAAKAMAAAAAD